MRRREVFGLTAAGLALATASAKAAGSSVAVRRAPRILRPPRIKVGDTIGLMIPSSANWNPDEIDILLESLAALGLKGRLGRHVNDRYGYLAGRDEDRAADLNEFFLDSDVKAIHCIRGGWGAARLLPFLDFSAIKRHPKALIGYSDITALLLSIHAKTGLVTFHGPNASSEWNATNVSWLQKVLWRGEQARFENPRDADELLAPVRHRTRTLVSGKAQGKLLGGNLTVLTSLLGTPYLPDFSGAVLFLEDIDEAPYRIDRMLVQLKLAGVLEQLSGFVWGHCTRCDPGEGFGSLTIPDLLADHIVPLGIPAYSGAMFGHISEQFTLPVGVEVELDADAGQLLMREPAVL